MAGADVNARTAHLGETALGMAAERLYVGASQLLLYAGADANAARAFDGRTPLHAVLALHAGAGASAQAVKMVRLLLKHGADAKARLPSSDAPCLHVAVAANTQQTESYGHGDTRTAKGKCVRAGRANEHDLEIVRRVLKASKDTAIAANGRGEQPLHLVAGSDTRRSQKLAKIFLDLGADPNAYAKDGTQPLHRACANGCMAIIKMLFDKAADPRGRAGGANKELVGRDGRTPMHFAALSGHKDSPEIVQMLVKQGADLTDEDDYRNTAQTATQLAIKNDPNLQPGASQAWKRAAIQGCIKVFQGRNDEIAAAERMMQRRIAEQAKADAAAKRDWE